jgi:peptide/nickel transport system ATP-binding protein
MDIDQRTYREIMDLRKSIQERAIAVESIEAELEREADDEDLTGEFVAFLLDRQFETDLSGAHRERVVEALAHVEEEEWAAAEALLRDHYESVCERREPVLQPDETNPRACHLYDQPDEAAAGDEQPASADD